MISITEQTFAKSPEPIWIDGDERADGARLIGLGNCPEILQIQLEVLHAERSCCWHSRVTTRTRFCATGPISLLDADAIAGILDPTTILLFANRGPVALGEGLHLNPRRVAQQ